MAGTFGYELDPGKLSDEEKQEISEQIQRYHSVEELIREGDWFRLTEEGNSRFTAWQSVSGDGEKSLLSLVITEPEGNPRPLHIRWKGLNPKRSYRLAWIQFYGCRYRVEEKIPETLSGAALMYGGFTLPRMYGDYPSVQVLITGE